MPSPMTAFAEVAARFGQVDPEDEGQVEQFFANQAPTLAPKQQAAILKALLEREGTPDIEPQPRNRRASAHGTREIRLGESPPVTVPDTALVPEQESAEIGEIAGTMALAFGSLFFTAGLDIRVSTAVGDRSVDLLLNGSDIELLESEGRVLLASMERIAEVLAERNDSVDRVTMRLGSGSTNLPEHGSPRPKAEKT